MVKVYGVVCVCVWRVRSPVTVAVVVSVVVVIFFSFSLVSLHVHASKHITHIHTECILNAYIAYEARARGVYILRLAIPYGYVPCVCVDEIARPSLIIFRLDLFG